MHSKYSTYIIRAGYLFVVYQCLTYTAAVAITCNSSDILSSCGVIYLHLIRTICKSVITVSCVTTYVSILYVILGKILSRSQRRTLIRAIIYRYVSHIAYYTTHVVLSLNRRSIRGILKVTFICRSCISKQAAYIRFTFNRTRINTVGCIKHISRACSLCRTGYSSHIVSRCLYIGIVANICVYYSCTISRNYMFSKYSTNIILAAHLNRRSYRCKVSYSFRITNYTCNIARIRSIYGSFCSYISYYLSRISRNSSYILSLSVHGYIHVTESQILNYTLYITEQTYVFLLFCDLKIVDSKIITFKRSLKCCGCVTDRNPLCISEVYILTESNGLAGELISIVYKICKSCELLSGCKLVCLCARIIIVPSGIDLNFSKRLFHFTVYALSIREVVSCGSGIFILVYISTFRAGKSRITLILTRRISDNYLKLVLTYGIGYINGNNFTVCQGNYYVTLVVDLDTVDSYTLVTFIAFVALVTLITFIAGITLVTFFTLVTLVAFFTLLTLVAFITFFAGVTLVALVTLCANKRLQPRLNISVISGINSELICGFSGVALVSLIALINSSTVFSNKRCQPFSDSSFVTVLYSDIVSRLTVGTLCTIFTICSILTVCSVFTICSNKRIEPFGKRSFVTV